MSSCALLRHVLSFPSASTSPMKCGISTIVCLHVSQLVFFCLLGGMQGLICTDSPSVDCNVVMQCNYFIIIACILSAIIQLSNVCFKDIICKISECHCSLYFCIENDSLLSLKCSSPE